MSSFIPSPGRSVSSEVNRIEPVVAKMLAAARDKLANRKRR